MTTLAELARRLEVELRGSGEVSIHGVNTLEQAGADELAFLANPKYRRQLASTRAGGVIVAPDAAGDCPVPALVTDNPYLVYARAAALLFPAAAAPAGVHPAAVVADAAKVDPSASIGPCAVVEAGALIGPGVVIGPGCVIGADCEVGPDSRLVANVTLCRATRVGARALLHPGVVLGADGFGLANDDGRWVKVPQLGRVVLGDDVEVGANTTIDRGALEDTVIGDGVKLDNLIMIAHNVRIGDHTAMAGCVGIAGSTRIGRNCTLGGGVGIAGHLEIGDDVHFSGMSLVTRSITEPGYYSGNLPAVPNREWRKSVARLRRLDELQQRVRRLEQQLKALGGADDTPI